MNVGRPAWLDGALVRMLIGTDYAASCFAAVDQIVIVRFPACPSRLNAIRIPMVLSKVCERRSCPARARGVLGQQGPAGAFLANVSAAHRRSEAVPDQDARPARIWRTHVARGSPSITSSTAERRFSPKARMNVPRGQNAPSQAQAQTAKSAMRGSEERRTEGSIRNP
jgi:hypothetical protein